jgi:spermidine synthase
MKNWFFEKAIPNLRIEETTKLAIKIKKKIFSGRSKYQKIEIIDTYPLGRILVLDGIIQLSQVDEFIYHEMITHLPLLYYPNPKKVLIIGGGDGGTLRETLKHPIKEVYLVEIDKKVIDISKKYLPFVSKNVFRERRVKIFIGDGLKFIKNYKNFFDVIIIDSTDPIGPSVSLFSKKFYQEVYRALNKNGIMITQSGTLFAQFSQVKKIFNNLKTVFPFVKIHLATIPAYGEGEFSFTVGSKKVNLERINPAVIKNIYKKINLKTKYYSPEIHFSSAILPKYLEEKLK